MYTDNSLDDEKHNDDEKPTMDTDIFMLPHPCIVQGMICYSHCVRGICECQNTIYKSCDCMQNTCDTSNYIIHYLNALFTKQHIEPLHNAWIRMSLIRTNASATNEYFYDSTYSYFNLDQMRHTKKSHRLSELMESTVKNMSATVTNNPTSIICEPWFCMKCEDDKHETMYVSRSWTSTTSFPTVIGDKSNMTFLSIEYLNGNQDPVIIELEPSWYYVGNELFTPVHIMHMLQHQNNPFVFSLDYKLRLLDNNIKFVELTSEYYVCLEKNGYKTYHVDR